MGTVLNRTLMCKSRIIGIPVYVDLVQRTKDIPCIHLAFKTPSLVISGMSSMLETH